jgi:hypothetical protein
VADGGGLEKGPNPCAMINSRAALISALLGPRAESWPRGARRPVRLGLARSSKSQAPADQPRTNPGLQCRMSA